MKKMKLIFSIILLIVFTIPIYSQIIVPAEYTDLNGKTYEGKVNLNKVKINKVVKFSFADGTQIDLSPANAKEINIMDYGRYVTNIKEGLFVKCLIEGSTNLYHDKEEFIIKKGTEIYTLNNKKNRWKGILKIIVSDCDKLALNNENKLKFDEEVLTNIIRDYNSCKGSQDTVYDNEKRKVKFYIGPSIGMAFTQMHFFSKNFDLPGTKYVYGSPTSLSPAFGLKFSIGDKTIGQKINFEFNPNFTFEKYTSEDLSVDANHSSVINTEIQSKSLFLPLIWKYKHFDNRKQRRFFNLGGGTKIIFKNEFTAFYQETHILSNLMRNYQENRTSDLRKFQLFGLIGYGFSNNINNNRISFSLNALFMTSQTNVRLKNIVTSIQLTASYDIGL